MLRVNPVNRQELLKRLTFHPKSLVFKTVSVPWQEGTFCQGTGTWQGYRLWIVPRPMPVNRSNWR